VNVEYLRCLALVAAAPGKRGVKELLLKFLQGRDELSAPAFQPREHPVLPNGNGNRGRIEGMSANSSIKEAG